MTTWQLMAQLDRIHELQTLQKSDAIPERPDGNRAELNVTADRSSGNALPEYSSSPGGVR
jgi:hypothetical protein